MKFRLEISWLHPVEKKLCLAYGASGKGWPTKGMPMVQSQLAPLIFNAFRTTSPSVCFLLPMQNAWEFVRSTNMWSAICTPKRAKGLRLVLENQS